MLKSIPKVIYRPPQINHSYSVSLSGNFCYVESDNRNLLTANIEYHDRTLKLRINPFEHHAEPEMMLGLCLEYLFSHIPEAKEAIVVSVTMAERRVRRIDFYQLPNVWHKKTSGAGVHYRRYVPSLQKTISFRTVDIDRDLNLFHEWHNQPRVYDLWELNKPKEELRVYLEDGLKDSHQIPMILEVDDVPTGYFEIYWAAQDRIAPYYEVHSFDRGFHFLIGSQDFLGVENTDAVLRSVNHFIYLDDERTQRIVAEPRSDNQRVLKYVKLVPGWQFVKEFDFPHKRAALLMNQRKDFFIEGTL